MKKIIFLMILGSFLLVGCGKHVEKDLLKQLTNKMEDSSGYHLSGELSVENNDENYQYLVDVCYQKKDLYKVTLTNKSNDHTQIILKNKDGVYVLTPSLNKSFKFQSDWPYNNSQIYLLNALIRDIEEDDQREFIEKNNTYIYKTKVHYPNNSKLVEQKIVINDKYQVTSASVYNNDGVEVMKMVFDTITFSPNFSEDEFVLDSLIEQDVEEEVNQTASLEDIIYPLFLPDGTKLVREEKVDKENGERVIMNYDGEKSFLLVEETADVFREFTVIPTSGEPYLLMDTLGVMTDNSLSWTSGGVEFYLVSDVMSQDEMIEVAQSIGGIVSMK